MTTRDGLPAQPSADFHSQIDCQTRDLGPGFQCWHGRATASADCLSTLQPLAKSSPIPVVCLQLFEECSCCATYTPLCQSWVVKEACPCGHCCQSHSAYECCCLHLARLQELCVLSACCLGFLVCPFYVHEQAQGPCMSHAAWFSSEDYYANRAALQNNNDASMLLSYCEDC